MPPPPERLYVLKNLNFDSNCKNKGFTLAETLITLGIIGVVASLTIPALIQNYKKQQTATQLKTTYSILAQAFEMAKTDYGDVSNWGLSSMYTISIPEKERVIDFVETYFLPYIKPTKNFGYTSFKNIGYGSIYNLDKTIATNAFFTKNLYVIALPNGAIAGFGQDGYCIDLPGEKHCTGEFQYTDLYVITDINGYKLPNTLGKDVFVMTMSTNSNSFKFYGWNASRKRLLEVCSKGNTENRQCGSLVQLDGWKINYDW